MRARVRSAPFRLAPTSSAGASSKEIRVLVADAGQRPFADIRQFQHGAGQVGAPEAAAAHVGAAQVDLLQLRQPQVGAIEYRRR